MAYMAAVAPSTWWPSPPAMPPAAAGLLAAASPSVNPEPQTLPFLPPPPPAGYPLLPPRGPILLQLHPGFLAEVDDRRSSALVQFLKDEGAVPSPEDEKKREHVIRELKKIVVHWAKVVACEQNVPQRLATATVLTYGSYTLGVHGPESDIDALCVGPCIATLQYHFFVVLRQILEGWPEVSEVQAVEGAKVPLMRFRFAGIAVDFTYFQLPVIDASKAINTFIAQSLQKIDERSWSSLSGVRVNEKSGVSHVLYFLPTFPILCLLIGKHEKPVRSFLLKTGTCYGVQMPNASMNRLWRRSCTREGGAVSQ